ncbi:MAG: DUF3106 domain-containing protein [Bacteroidota bacterium]
MAKRRLAGGVILCLALIAPLRAETPTAVVIGTPPQPTWAQLDTTEKNILAPLSANWDEMENIRRKKWRGIAERYPSMTPAEQGRVQVRMRDWAALTPEQRTKARNSYKEFNQLPTEQKQTMKQKWEAYSNLPSEEKQRIRASGKSSKLLTPPPEAAPAPTVAPAAESNTPPAAPDAGASTSEAIKR